jgi:hypothetical protein
VDTSGKACPQRDAKHKILHCTQELELALKLSHTYMVKALLSPEELVGQNTKLHLYML